MQVLRWDGEAARWLAVHVTAVGGETALDLHSYQLLRLDSAIVAAV